MRVIDLTGQSFGKWTVLSMHSERDEWNRAQFVCRCTCGTVRVVASNNLRRGISQSCGKCVGFVDLVGLQFNRLSVLSKTDKRAANGGVIWKCRCVCGKVTYVRSDGLLAGTTSSCGCYHNEDMSKRPRALRHGAAQIGKITPEYIAYHNAVQRTTNPNNASYSDYGGRGIEVRFRSFEDFYEELGSRPGGMSLDRIDNNGHYEKGNVRWATPREQANNKRNNRKVTHM